MIAGRGSLATHDECHPAPVIIAGSPGGPPARAVAAV
jgi:hypothetical protein